MSEINTEGKNSGKKGKPKKMSTKVDLTPMVDLGFLLITFFLLTTTMIKPQTMELAMPSKDKPKTDQQQNKIKDTRAVTIILGKDNKVFYWEGMTKNGVKPQVKVTNFSSTGIRKFLIERNIDIMKQVRDLDKERLKKNMPDSIYNRKKLDIQKQKTAPYVIIKATNDATYKNLIDALDEMAICNIGGYAIVDITKEDNDMIKTAN
jgi:biopolymer transport protein ExbD